MNRIMEFWKHVIVLFAVLTLCYGINTKVGLRFRRSFQYCPPEFYYVHTTEECCPCSTCPRSSSDYVARQCLEQYKQGIINDVNLLCESFVPNSCWDLEYAYEYMKRTKNASSTTKPPTTKLTTTTITTTTTAPKTTTTTAATARPTIALSLPVNDGLLKTEEESWATLFLVSLISVGSAVCVLILVLLCYFKFGKIREFYEKCRCRMPDSRHMTPALPLAPIPGNADNNQEPAVDERPAEEEPFISRPIEETGKCDTDLPQKTSYPSYTIDPPINYSLKPTMECTGETYTTHIDEKRQEHPNKAEPFTTSSYNRRTDPRDNRQDSTPGPITIQNNNDSHIYVITSARDVHINTPQNQHQPEQNRYLNQPPPEYHGDQVPSYQPPAAEHFRSTDYNSAACSSRPSLSSQTASTLSEPRDEVRSCETFPMRNEDNSFKQLYNPLDNTSRNYTQRVCSSPVSRNLIRPSETSAKVSHYTSEAETRNPAYRRDYYGPHHSVDRMPEMMPSCSGEVSTQVSVEADVAEDEDIYSSSEDTASIIHPPDDSHRPEQ